MEDIFGEDGGQRKYFSLIRESIEIESFAEKRKVSELMDVMVGVICSDRETVRANGSEPPIEQVRKQFSELRRKHIE